MQQVIVFKKRSFLASDVDITRLNEKIAQLNVDGWRVVQVASNSSLMGLPVSYTLLVERD